MRPRDEHDGESSDPSAERQARRRALLVISTVACGSFVAGMDQNIVVTAIPAMARSFHETPLHLSVAVTSYILSLAVFAPVSGWAVDRFGARRVYCVAVALFTIASVLCGLSQTLWELALARAVQGVGGAMIRPVGQLVLFSAFSKDQLLRINSRMQMAVMLGPLGAPIIGGFLTSVLSWSWIFYVNVPLGLVSILLARRLFDDEPSARRVPFDVSGFILVGLSLAALQLGIDGLSGSVSVWTLSGALFIAAFAGFAGFIVYSRRARHPLLDLSLLRIRTFFIPYLRSGLFDGLGICSMAFLLPMLLQVGFGMDPLHAGVETAAVPFGVLMARFVAPPLLRRFGFRGVLLVNTVITTAIIAAFFLLRSSTPGWLVMTAFFAFGLAQGVQFFSSTNLAYADIPRERLTQFAPLAAVIGQVEVSAAVGLGAGLLAVLSTPGRPISPVVFLIEAAVVLFALTGYLKLERRDGVLVSGHGAALLATEV
jgi:EmrB/QacA subfamily drug resistance transporter